MTLPDTRAMLQKWRDNAPFWSKHAAIVAQMFAPITDALIDRTGIQEGQSVLDVAGGTGEPSLSIASVVGPLGAVMCTDAAIEMVAAAEVEARRRRIGNVAFHQAMADSLPFDSGAFDVAVCRLGVMLFPEPAAAVAEMLRVIRPGGAIGLAVWSGRVENPFLTGAAETFRKFVEILEDEEDAPGPFRFSQRGRLADLVERTGFERVQEQLLSFDVTGPVPLDSFWDLKIELSGTLRPKLAGLDEQTRELVKAEALAAFEPYFSSGEMRIPARVIIVSGRKPERAIDQKI
jgi:ubiquinone/menaquinone biosynthesis C-methylase UbiE